MAANDITIFDDGTYLPGSKRYKVVKGRTSAINVGELVVKIRGSAYVTAWTPGGAASSAKPSIGTDFLVGLSTSTSTETNTANGVVDVMPVVTGMTFLCSPDVAATWDTQAEYDALVGDRVLLAYSSTGVFTVLASDYGGTDTTARAATGSGVIVEPLDIVVHPGKVRFSLAQRLMYNN